MTHLETSLIQHEIVKDIRHRYTILQADRIQDIDKLRELNQRLDRYNKMYNYIHSRQDKVFPNSSLSADTNYRGGK